MKFNTISIVALLVGMIVIGSCNKKYTADYRNLNQPSTVPPSLLLRNILYDMWDAPFNQDERNDQFTLSNYVYYDDNLYWDGTSHSQYASLSYSDLWNVLAMEKEASKAANGSTTTAYHAMGKFFRAWYYYQMTLK